MCGIRNRVQVVHNATVLRTIPQTSSSPTEVYEVQPAGEETMHILRLKATKRIIYKGHSRDECIAMAKSHFSAVIPSIEYAEVCFENSSAPALVD